MLQEAITYEQLYIKDGFFVEMRNDEQLVQLKFSLRESSQLKIYKSTIYSLNNTNKLSYYFNNFVQLKQFLRNANNIKINKQMLLAQLLVRHPLGNDQIVQSISLQLIIDKVLKQMGIEHIISRCRESSDLQGEQTKKFMYILALQMQMLKQKYINHQHRYIGIQNKQLSASYLIMKQQSRGKQQNGELLDSQIKDTGSKQKQQLQNLLKIQKSKISKQLQLMSASIQLRQKRIQENMKQSDKKIKQISNNIEQIKTQVAKINSINTNKQADRHRSRLRTDFNHETKSINFRTVKKNQFSRARKQDQSTQIVHNKYIQGGNQIIHRLDSQQLILKNILDTLAHFQEKQSIINATYPMFPINYQDFVDPQCFHFNKLIVQANLITTKPDTYAYVIGKVNLKQNNRFSVTIRKMKTVMFIGVVSRQLRTHASLSDSLFRIYYQNNRYCWDGKSGKSQGPGFKQKDKIIVEVDIKNGIIYWKQGTNILVKCYCSQLKDEEVKWVPYLFLTNGGDSVEVVQW